MCMIVYEHIVLKGLLKESSMQSKIVFVPLFVLFCVPAHLCAMELAPFGLSLCRLSAASSAFMRVGKVSQGLAFAHASAAKRDNNLGPALDPLDDGHSKLELLAVGGSDLSIVNAARTSYGRSSDAFTEADRKLLEDMWKKGHHSPFEQTFLQFGVTAPIFVTRQWMRHRIASYNELSARYTQMKPDFYVPKRLFGLLESDEPARSNEKELQDAYRQVLESSAQVYKKMLAAGVTRERARGVLPVGLYTHFKFGCNVRALLHFLDLRASSHAQEEIRQYAKGLAQLANPHFPATMNVWAKQKDISWIKDLQGV